jgi:hypothetical protein
MFDSANRLAWKCGVGLVAGTLLAGCVSSSRPKDAAPHPGGGPVVKEAPATPAPVPDGGVPFLVHHPDGRAGFYYAPDDPAKRPIDARGFAPGTEVMSPYSRKIYRVPPPVKN